MAASEQNNDIAVIVHFCVQMKESNYTRRLGKVGLTPSAADATGTFTCHVGRDLVGFFSAVSK